MDNAFCGAFLFLIILVIVLDPVSSTQNDAEKIIGKNNIET
jgi:hypothetical protein